MMTLNVTSELAGFIGAAPVGGVESQAASARATRIRGRPRRRQRARSRTSEDSTARPSPSSRYVSDRRPSYGTSLGGGGSGRRHPGASTRPDATGGQALSHAFVL